MLPLFAVVILLSSALVFLVQPMFARMVLPVLGGSPSVWNTAMLFYQAVLLAGYGYAHLAVRWLGVRRQAWLHAVVILLPLLFLPIAVPEGASPPAEAEPSWWLLGVMAVAIGLPFFVVSTTSPLLQRYFVSVGHRDSSDPYFLYVASNAGSVLALLAYPLVLEPLTTTTVQGWVWAGSYGLLTVLLLVVVALIHRRGIEHRAAGSAVPGAAVPALPLRTRLWWVGMAFVPSSLMLSVTTYISTDLAAAPLLWVIPLGLYLVSFILVFGRRTSRVIPVFRRALPIALVALVMVLALGSTRPIEVMVPVHLLVFLVVAVVCHGALAEGRPAPAHLTDFYLWMAVGGVLGGLFNALVAPHLFTSVAEYPIVLVLAALLASPGDAAARDAPARGRLRRAAEILLPPAAIGIATALLILLVEQTGLATSPPGLVLCFGIPTFAAYFLSRSRVRFGLALGVVLLASGLYGEPQDLLVARRSFFGIHRVSFDPATNRHQLAHGNTLHGQQSLEPSLRRIPMAYYHPGGPAGAIFAAYGQGPDRRIAGVGLGAGALAAYAQPGQSWTFFEIDPAVVELASDPRYFTYLSDAPVPIGIRVGDARLRLAEAPDGSFDLMALDAYSSDAIPVHLATKEAVALYLRKLTPGGILAFHLSNQHLDLVPILANIARALGLACIDRFDQGVSPEEEKEGKEPSQWLVMGRSMAHLSPLLARGDWRLRPGAPGGALWTDDHNSILDALLP